MNTRLKPLVAALALVSLMALPVHAAVSNADVQDLTAQAKELKKSLASLQSQVNELEHHVERAKKASKKQSSSQKSDHADTHVSTNGLTGKQLLKLIREEREFLPFDLDVPGQAFVSTGPYVGVPFQFAGNDLIINSPSVDIDVQLLNIRKSIMTQLRAMGGEIVQEPYHSHLLLSGVIEGSVEYVDRAGAPSTSDIGLSNVNLGAFVLGPSEWMLGYLDLSYVEVAPVDDVFGGTSQYRVSNSRVAVNKAFVTIGNFTQSPFYGSIGQLYVPYGQYSSVMISSPLTKALGRTKARAIVLGFQQQQNNGFIGSIFAFRGDSHAESVAKINNGGMNLAYKFKGDFLAGRIGASFIGNLADSGGMQIGNGFQNAEQLVHRAPGYNLRGVVSVGEHLDLIGEYISATTRFNPNDMSFNNHGAKPSAFDFEAAYAVTLFETKPSSIALGYSQSQQALAMGLPLNRLALVLNTSWWRNTLQSLEIRRDREYAASDVATGGGGVVSTPETGKVDKAIMASFDYYF